MAEQLGAYVLEKRIGAGGMADVFLARGPQGVCVIKRPHSHLCANGDFVRMFLDEASLLAQLNHPGIARIFDLGQHNGVYYLAMEYVPGFDLMTISLEHERQGEYMAPELAAKVVADAAGALHYAHDAVGTTGERLNIIHRDVSPHNILVSTRGEVKLIDFGVARATKTMHRTQAGLVKGKYPYMSPEQITGQLIDRRVDVYALGLVLYELLTNARAIAGDLEVQQIENARHGRVKPVEQLRPNIPPALRKILERAIHPQPEGRFETAALLQSALEGFIVEDRHVVGREDLLRLFRVVAAEASHLPRDLDPPLATPLPDDGHDPLDGSHPTDQVPLTQVSQASAPRPVPIPLVSPVPLADGVQVGGAAGPVPLQLNQVAPGRAHLEHVTEQEIPSSPAVPAPRAMASKESSPATSLPRKRSVLAPALLAVIALALGSWFLATREKSPPPIEAVEVQPIPTPAPVPEAPANPPAVAEVPPEEVAPPAPAAVKAAILKIEANPAMEVVIDGKSWGVTPIDPDLPEGKHTVVLQNRDLGLKRVWPMNLLGGEKKAISWNPKKGKLVVHVEPYGTIAVDGRVLKTDKSIADAELWEGAHTVVVTLVDPSLKRSLTRIVTVKPGETAELTLNMLTDQK